MLQAGRGTADCASTMLHDLTQSDARAGLCSDFFHTCDISSLESGAFAALDSVAQFHQQENHGKEEETSPHFAWTRLL